MIVMIDHYDSFTYNIVHYIEQINPKIKVFKSNEVTIEQLKQINPTHIILSPGPGHPDDATLAHHILDTFINTPILGVCLGFQVIVSHFGGEIIQLPPVHGYKNEIQYEPVSVFRNLNGQQFVGRYHSLGTKAVPNALQQTAVLENGIVMGIMHKTRPIHGIQFHPESVLTDEGFKMIETFLSEVHDESRN